MSNELFVKSADPLAGVAGALRSATHKMCAVLDAENPEEYRFGAAQGSVQGTLVPLGSRKGGIKNSQNPFGSIVAGVEFVEVNGELIQRPFQPTHLAQMIPGGSKVEEVEDAMEAGLHIDGEYDAEAVREANDMLEKQAAIRKQEFQESINTQREAELELQAILDTAGSTDMSPQAAPAENQMLQMMTTVFQKALEGQMPAAPTAPVVEPAADLLSGKGIKVKLQGKFGKYRAVYPHCYVEEDVVVLVHKEDADIFTPPVSNDPIILGCNGESYTVYFAGIEFDLPFANCGVQVFIRFKQE